MKKFILLVLMALLSSIVQAGECGLMQLMENKSRGIDGLSGDCAKPSGLTVGDSIALTPKGRVWLKVAKTATASGFQMICQNRSEKIVNIKITQAVLPWLAPQGLGECQVLGEKKLNCKSAEGKGGAFVCAIAALKSPTSGKTKKIERTSSVKMRSIFALQAKIQSVDTKEIISQIKPEVELCRSLYPTDAPINVSWIVGDDARAKSFSIELTGDNLHQELSDCIESVVITVPAMGIEKDTAITHEF